MGDRSSYADVNDIIAFGRQLTAKLAPHSLRKAESDGGALRCGYRRKGSRE